MATVRIYVKLKYEGQTPAFYDISHRVNYESLTWESNSEGTSANANIPVWTILPKSQNTISSYSGATFTDRLNAAILDESFLIEIPNRAEVRIIDTSTNPDTLLFAGIITRVSSQREGSTIVQTVECADNTAILEEHIVADYYAPRDSRDIDIIYGGTTTYTSAASLPQLVGQIDGLSLLSESTGGSLSDGTYEVRAQARSSTLTGRDGSTPQYGPVTKVSSLALTAGTGTQKLKVKWKSPGSANSVRIYVTKTAGTGSSTTEYLAKTLNVLTGSIAITAASRTSNVVEITTATAHGLSAGDPIIVTIPQTPGFSVGQEDFAIITSVPSSTTIRYAKTGDDGSATTTNASLTSGGAAIIQSYSTVESPTVLTTSSARGWSDGEIYTVAGANWRIGIGPDNVRSWLYPISVFGGLFDSSWVTDIGLNTSTYVQAVDTQYRFSPYFQESDTPNAEQYGGRTVRQILDYISEKTGAEYWVDKGSIDGLGNYSTNLHYGAKTPKELVVNGLYDGNLNGWTTASGFTLQASTSGPYGAGYSVLSSTSNTTITTDSASRPTTVPGKKYFFSVRGKVSAHQGRLGAYVLWYNSSGTQIHSDQLGNIPGDPLQTWHRIWKIIQAPANAAYFGLEGQCTSSQTGSAAFTDWSAIELTGSLGYGETEDPTSYAVPIYEMEIPTSPVESGNTANRLHLYAVFRTKDSSGNKVALTDISGNPVQYVDYDFVPGVWATNGKIVEAAITDDRVETLADAELSAAGYWKENGLPIESYTFKMRPWDADGNEYPVPEVGQIIPFIWETLGVAKPLIVKSVAAEMVGMDIVYTITVGGDVRLQRSAFIRLSEKIKELEAVNPVPDIPDSPSDLTVSSNDKMISLAWSFDEGKEINKKLSSFEVQRQDAIFKVISEVSRSGSTVTVTTSAEHGLVNGDTIRVDLDPTQTSLSGLEGQWTVSSTTTTSFTYSSVTSGTIASTSAEGYVYYLFTEFRTVQNTKATYVNDSGLVASLQYRYKVRSLSSDLTASDFSETTEPIAPNEPTVTVADGSITAEKLAASLKAIEIISSATLPTLPSASYPSGTFVYHLGGTPPGLRRSDGSTWVNAVGSSDIVANSITAGLISAAGLDASVIKSGALVIDSRFGAGNLRDVSFKAQSGTTATLTTTISHGYSSGNSVKITNIGAPFDGTFTILASPAPTATKFSYTVGTSATVAETEVSPYGASLVNSGTNAITSTNFTVSNTGAITATSATISGAITATSGTFTGSITASGGTIGGFTINASSLTAGSSGNSVGMAPGTFPFFAGNATASSAPFRVSSAGLMTATGATLNNLIVANSGTKPSILANQNNTYGEIAVNAGTAFRAGHYDEGAPTATAFTARFGFTSDGTFQVFNGTAGGSPGTVFSVDSTGTVTTSANFTSNGNIIANGADVFIDALGAEDPALTFRTEANSILATIDHDGTTLTIDNNIVGGSVVIPDTTTVGTLQASALGTTSGTGQINNMAMWVAITGGHQIRRSTGTSWARFKKEIASTPLEIDVFKSLNFVKFKWDADAMRSQWPDLHHVDSEIQHGLLIDDLIGTFPDAINTPESDSGDVETVNWHNVYMLAMVSLQKAIVKIEALEARVAELEG